MMEHEDPRFEQWLRDAARSYHVPPATPAGAMWARIAARRRRRHLVIRMTRWAVAAAAMLAVGIGIGRWSARPAGLDDAAAPLVAEALPLNGDSRALIYHVAATEYLSRTESFLTGFRAERRRGDAEISPRFVGQARDLLGTTRLMLDSPLAEDARLRVLLEDLELLLVQIVQLDAGGGADADLITQGMDQRNLLPKLRSAIPAGPLPRRTEGAL